MKQAYLRQDHTLGVQSFIENGVRPELIPLLISYFENRTMQIKWHGQLSEPRNLPGSGAQGSNLGNLEFLSQTNSYADCVPSNNKFKFVDDLSVLEVINLLSIGISSFNTKHQVPSDLPNHGQFIESRNLKSQGYLTKLDTWAENHLMEISKDKTKAMIFNFTDKYQFSTRLNLKGKTIDIVEKTKLLGCHINSKLNWDDNCDALVSKVNKRMQLIRKVWSYGCTLKDIVHLWKVYCVNILEQYCVIWNSSFCQQNTQDLEKTQNGFAKLVLQKKYIYNNHKLLLN